MGATRADIRCRRLALAILAFVLIVGQLNILAGEEETDAKEATIDLNRHPFRLPKLFDFAHFKRAFHKHYGSWREELSRKRLFFARALSAFVTGVKYKLRQIGHYNAVNHMSDYTPNELDKMRNKRLAEQASQEHKGGALRATRRGGTAHDRGYEKLPMFISGTSGDVELELAELVKSHGHETGYAQLDVELRRREPSTSDRLDPAHNQRRRRSVAEQPPMRDLSMDDDDELTKGDHAASDASELKGLTAQQKDVKMWKLSRTGGDKKVNSQPEASGISQEPENESGNMVLFDHRDSGCLLPPRDQGICGACYAFASMAIIEWLHCKRTGKLVPFSEQYIIDCGKGRYDGKLDGCDGAADEAIARFWANFGVELRENYPYKGTEEQCPYKEDFNLTKTGSVRFEFSDALFIPQEKWERFIERMPIYIAIKSPDEFTQFGGGIDDGGRCGQEADHAMLLVGHGREEGREYWIIRNSFSTKWGESGYYRLAKNATKRCLDADGLVFGTKDGITFKFEIKNTGLGVQRRPENLGEKMFKFFRGK